MVQMKTFAIDDPVKEIGLNFNFSAHENLKFSYIRLTLPHKNLLSHLLSFSLYLYFSIYIYLHLFLLHCLLSMFCFLLYHSYQRDAVTEWFKREKINKNQKDPRFAPRPGQTYTKTFLNILSVSSHSLP